jgi:uracil-DNA glycosylase
MEKADTDDGAELDAIHRGVKAQLRRLGERRVAWVPAAPPPAPVAAPVAAVAPAAAAPRVSAALAQVRAELGECTRCKLHPTRKNIVFGIGNPNAELMFVGEAPGNNEDLQGEPFVGDAGQLLTKMIIAMGYRREDVYIANCVKCRPPGNRNPEADELEACEPFLKKQIAAIQPRVIVALGKFAAQWLSGKRDAAISALRGKWHTYQGIQVMPTYHPAYLLRTPSAKRTVWEDLQLVMAELGKTPP